jgi:hypothetical protein
VRCSGSFFYLYFMAWPNIDERRDKVKSLMDAGVSDKEIKQSCSAEFDCSTSAIDSDIRGFRGTQYHYKRNKIVAQQSGYKCQYCGKPEKDGVLEHVISRSMGGHDEPYNLTYACWSCNTLKKMKVWIPDNLNEITKDNLEWREKVISMASPKTSICGLPFKRWGEKRELNQSND